MRTTLNIDDDVLAVARERAEFEGKTIGDVISSLVRKALFPTESTPRYSQWHSAIASPARRRNFDSGVGPSINGRATLVILLRATGNFRSNTNQRMPPKTALKGCI
jgi:hypothetical protein